MIQKYRKESKIKGLITPNYKGYGICNLPDTFAKIFSAPNSRPLKLDQLYGITDSIDNLVFLLLDGFGYNLVKDALTRSTLPAFQEVTSESLFVPLTSVFPSTTSAATTTLHTGLTPQEHGILGYTMYLQEIGAISQMLRFTPVLGRNSLFDLGFDPQTFIGSETIHEKMVRNGIPSSLYISSWIVDSGLSKISNRGARIFPHMAASDMFVQLRRNLEIGRGGFHFAYFASPDTIAHAKGPFTEEYASEVDAVFYSLRRELLGKLDTSVAKRTSIIISADHGLVNVDPDQIIDYSKHRELRQLLKVPPTGDSRALFLHAKSGQESKVEEYFETNLRGKFHLFDSRTLLEREFFGSGHVKQEVFDRVGSLTAIPASESIAMDNSDMDRRSDPYPGRHGGLSENEIFVPLIARKLA
ncbi:MAG: alkaline phosphatase family protein [Nitrososphaerales archaeon]